ncbi:glutathione S-transferase T1 isoform X3 [Physcomitrium patens]|uniref:Theta class glutathione S-transferase n=1 Tax=Physcomitrium patens TaxID=3218 RepID=A0A2K1KD83_PHYPA|nr:glutathione S-transferase T1-like isoform X3 [Physcomitrium patens]PNR51733.1 hypothetical protein PHYPA_010921 [Physcomitrium patens]|eukprot:XP_024381082.1 glutathione S-transferase T1-like isoform X3 [Physcomitrella patens]
MVNKIEAHEIGVDLRKLENRTPEFRKINPMGLVPCIDDHGFKLHESHAIMRYLATTHNVADHWYPKDPQKRALVDAALDWHHLNLRKYGSQLVINRVLVKVPAHKNFFPNLGEETRKSLADDASKTLPQILDALELMLEHGKFLHNADLVSIADLSLCCELTQLQLLDKDDHKNMLEHRKRITTWMADVKDATNPEFTDVHQAIFNYSKHVEELRAQGNFF